MLKKFRHLKLYIQIFIMSTITISILLILLTALSKKTVDTFRKTNDYYTNELIYQLEKTIYSNYNSLSDIIRFVSFQSDIQNFLLENYEPSKYDLYGQMRNNLMNVLDLNSQIMDIVIMDTHGTTYNLTENKYKLPVSQKDSNKIVLSSLVTDTYLKSQYFIMHTPIYSTSTLTQPNSYIGSIYLIVSKNAFTEANTDTYTKTQSKLYLTDARGQYFWSNNTSDYPSQQTSESSDYKITTLANIGLHVISIAEKEETIYAILKVQIRYLTVLIFCIALLTSVWVLLIKNMMNPLYQLVSFISSIKDGVLKDLNKRVQLEGYYEIEVISNEFNGMLSSIDTLTRQLFTTTSQLYEAEILKKQVELEYLRSQINPHFLYNVLESIKGIAAEHNQPQIVTITKSLATIFKYSVKGQSEVPLREELKIVSNYINIQLFRFEDRFHVEYEIDEECLDYLVPKMILQPIVENAIVHGVENCDNNARLLVKSFRNNQEELEIMVYNDGQLIDETLLSQIEDAFRSSDPLQNTDSQKGIGLYNVNNRIKLSYGKKYGLQIISAGTGTSVIYHLPVKLN